MKLYKYFFYVYNIFDYWYTNMPEPSIVKLLQSFREKGIPFLQTLTNAQLNKMIHVANEEYHGHQSASITLQDQQYDILREYVEKVHPDADALQEIGTQIEKHKVQLPVNMPSMDKIKPDTNALSQWKNTYKGPYLVSCKLDGVSGLYYAQNGNRKLFTRGNGTVGQDVSHLLKYINIPKIENVIVRGEFIISKENFQKYKNKTSNMRNMVAGIVNRKKQDNKARDIDFVAYEVIEPSLKPSQQMGFLLLSKFLTVKHIHTTQISNETLSNMLIKWRENYDYEMDGIIVGNDDIYTRTTKNPVHAFAFKMIINDQVAETQVIDVIWTASKDGYLKPRIRVNPVHIGGVKIEYATGFHGQFIEENKIGIGALVQIVRSGDVIPYIKAVTTPAHKAKMPDVPYTWTSTHTDIMLVNKEDDPIVLEKQITGFFTYLEVDGLSIGNVRKLMKSGFNTVSKILHMQPSHFLQVEGFKEKMTEKLYNGIQTKIRNASLIQILAASNTLGRGLGEKRIKPIFERFPEILTSNETANEKIYMLQQVDGIGKENASTFVSNISSALKFLSECKLEYKLKPEPISVKSSSSVKSSNKLLQNKNEKKNQTHPLHEKSIIFTGFREKELMKTLETEYKVQFASSVSKNTLVLVIKDTDTSNAKTIKAVDLGVPIMTISDFRAHYGV
jgi:DNA ligase (NAD+)